MNARGRPRQFDQDNVLAAATQVFWRNGYQGSSLADLCAATGLNKPSLYAAFGDKEQLYLRALDHYVETWGQRHYQRLNDTADISAALRGFFYSIAEMLAGPGQPGACLVTTATAECGAETMPPAVEAAVLANQAATEAALAERLRHAVTAGQLAADFPVATTAAYLMVLGAGFGVQARRGMDLVTMRAVIDLGLAWLP